MRGLYLAPPHGQLIANGRKTMLVKSSPEDLHGEWTLVSGDQAFGRVVFGHPFSVDIKQFNDFFDAHRVKEAERRKWWPIAPELYLYEVLAFEPFPDGTKQIDVPAGVTMNMGDIDLGEKADPSRSQCMKCKNKPDIDLQWADGRGRAWFCQKCYGQWLKEYDGDPEIVRAWAVTGDEVPKTLKEYPNDNHGARLEDVSPDALLKKLQSLQAGEKALQLEHAEKGHDGVMVALYVPHKVARLLELESDHPQVEATPPEEMHVTLAYLGPKEGLEDKRGAIEKVVQGMAEGHTPITGKLNGLGRFSAAKENGMLEPLYANFDSPGLGKFRQELVEKLDKAGAPAMMNHGFTPHITLAYVPPMPSEGLRLPPNLPILPESLSLSWGDERMDFPFKQVATKELAWGQKPWTMGNPPPPAKNWTADEQKRCIAAANAALESGASEQDAIFACIRASGKSAGAKWMPFDDTDPAEAHARAHGLVLTDQIDLGPLHDMDGANVYLWAFKNDKDQDIFRVGIRFDPVLELSSKEQDSADVCIRVISAHVKALTDDDIQGAISTAFDGLEQELKGGPGSGNWGHFGRIGLRGGSSSAELGSGGLGRLGVDKDTSPEERREAAERIRKQREARAAKPTEKAALEPFKVRPEDHAAYQDAMDLTSPEARAMLDRLGLTREETYKMIDDARVKQQAEPSTKSKHEKNGVYTPERQALHDEIVQKTVADKPRVPEGEQPTILLTGGYPGSGKSSMLKNPEYSERLDDFVHVDSDNFKGLLGAADGVSNMGWRAQAYHEESADIVGRVMQAAIAGHQNVLFDGTMKTSAKMQTMVKQFQDMGYRVEVAFADLPMRKSMTRAIGRFIGGGRFVDPAYIASHDAKNLGTLNDLKGLADSWRHWNTDVPFGSNAELVGEG